MLQPNDLFVETDFDEPIQSINVALETCQLYKKSYQRRKALLPSYFNDRQVDRDGLRSRSDTRSPFQIRYWEVPDSIIFQRCDHFLDRLHMLKDIVATAQDCSIYESIEIGGVDADELQAILQKVIGDFKGAYAAFRGE